VRKLLLLEVLVKELGAFLVFEEEADAVAPLDEGRRLLLRGRAPGPAALGVRRARVDTSWEANIMILKNTYWRLFDSKYSYIQLYFIKYNYNIDFQENRYIVCSPNK
jgi:hypothetical protein